MSWGIRQRNIICKKVEVLYEITDAKRKSVEFRALPKIIFGRKV